MLLHLLLYSLTVAFLHYFFIMPVGSNLSNLNLTYGLKPQVSSIKIVTVYRWSIFQVESHYTTRTAPLLVASTKLSPVRHAPHLDGWPNTNTPCWNNFCFSSFPFEGDVKDWTTLRLVLSRFFYFWTVCSFAMSVHVYIFTTSYK